MQFSNTTTKAGIIQMIEQITNLGDANISGVTLKLAHFTNLVNSWLHIATNWIQEVQGEWAYDDGNHGDFNIETFALTDNQQDYGLNTDSLVIKRVEIQLVSSNDWYDLDFCYEQNIVDNWDGQDKGTPSQYWLSGGSILFDVPPDITKVDNYRLTYDRNAHLFLTSDTTAEPGIDPKFQMILVYGPSMEWALANNNGAVAQLCQKMLYGSDARRDKGLKEMLQKFYANRAREAYRTPRRYVAWK